MFYCESCRQERSWPEGWTFSRGPCELCGEVARCHDVPSRNLPIPDKARQEIIGMLEDAEGEFRETLLELLREG